MKYEARFELDFPPEVISQYMVDPLALKYVVDHHPEIAKLEVLEDRTEGEMRYVKVRYQVNVPVPAAIKKVLKADPNSFVIDMKVNNTEHFAEFKVIPDIMADKFEGSGKVYYRREGERWTQYMEGEITVKFFGVGGMMEKFAVNKAKESFGQEVKLRNDYLLALLGKGK